MKALVLNHKRQLELQSFQIPEAGKDEIIIQVHFSPINPSDLLFLQGHYNSEYFNQKKPLPTVPGFEGSGIVQTNGKRLKKGMKVCFFASSDSFYGAWGEYTVAKESNCIEIQDIELKQAACGCVNPLTALYMLHITLQSKQNYVIQTAAASQCGRMFTRIAKQYNIHTVNIVRSKTNVEKLLNEEQAKYVFNSTDPEFKTILKSFCESKDIHLAFDSIGSQTTSQLASILQPNSEIYVYGALDPKPCQISQSNLIFKNISIKGLWLTKWIEKQGHLDFIENLSKLLQSQLKSQIKRIVRPEDFESGISQYSEDMSSGKVLLSFNQPMAKL